MQLHDELAQRLLESSANDKKEPVSLNLSHYSLHTFNQRRVQLLPLLGRCFGITLASIQGEEAWKDSEEGEENVQGVRHDHP